MQSNKERIVAYYDLSLTTVAVKIRGLQVMKLSKLADLLVQTVQFDNCLKASKDGRNKIYIQDVKNKPHSLTLLISHSDQDRADPSFSDPNKNTYRKVRKKDGEGDHTSAHITISKQPKNGTYLTLIEMSPSLGASRIQSFLNWVFRRVAANFPDQFLQNHPDGSVNSHGEAKKVKTRPLIELSGHLSNAFKKDLKNGTITGLEIFTRANKHQPWDSHAYTIESRRSVHIQVSRIAKGANPWTVVNSLLPGAKDESYETCRIRFRTSNNVPRSADIDTYTGNLGVDSLYVRKEKISGFKSKLESGYDTVNVEIESKMLHLLARG